MQRVALVTLLLAACAAAPPRVASPAQLAILHPLLDAYIDQRFEHAPTATTELLTAIAHAHATDEQVQALLEEGRAAYPASPQPLGTITENVPVTCYHVDYSSIYDIYVPADYDSKKAWPLIVVGHGGNSSMSAEYARKTALSYLKAYAPAFGEGTSPHAILVAPATERGWSLIGDSLLFSTISKVSRDYHVDPDRIYLIGQSMGGHLSWRSAFHYNDRWAGVSPQSGGYTDYIASGQMPNLFGLPGYTTFGQDEPYGLRETNVALAAWLAEHHYPWVTVQEAGGHEIYESEQPKIAAFFAAHKRDLYASRVYLSSAGNMKYTSNWSGQTDAINPARAFRWNQNRWLQVTPRDDGGAQQVYGEIKPGNRIELTSNGVRQVRVYLHAAMGLDFTKPLTVVVNGVTRFHAMAPAPQLGDALELVREWDDSARFYPRSLTLPIATDATMAVPSYSAATEAPVHPAERVP